MRPQIGVDAAEVADDRGERGRHDRLVERREEHRQQQAGEREREPAVARLVCGGRGVQGRKVSDSKNLVQVKIWRLCKNPDMTAAPMGLRERKKLATRQLIAETARRLFAERGFDGVTVAEIARAAEVSEKTVFNYFPTKEDLVYWQLEAFEAQILGAIAGREPGESALDAFRRFVLQPRGLIVEK